MTREPASYGHAFRLFFLIAAILVTAVVLRTLLVPDGFGKFGHYRAGAIEDFKQAEPRHVGRKVCETCHDDITELHAKDAHSGVACESCHGPGAAHVAADGEGGIRRPAGQELCLVCHRLMLARPGDFGQIVPEDHYRLVGVADKGTPCMACHNPHEPLFMDRDLRTARLHPLIHRCRDCHAGRYDDTLTRPENHPPIFTCDYCHGEIAKDFVARPHHGIRCTTCHLFFRESESAGRIVRDADPRFCLLCHRDAPFRGENSPPGIEWPEHREAMAESEDDLGKRCIDCHQDRIHRLQSRRTAALEQGSED